MVKKQNGTVVLDEAEAVKYQLLMEKEAAENKAAAEAAEQQKRREQFDSLLPKHTGDQLADLVAAIKPLCSIRAIHPEHGMIEGVVADTVPVYVRKGETRGQLKHTEIDVISASSSWSAEGGKDVDGKPIMRDCHVYAVRYEWVLELGDIVALQFGPKSSAKGSKKANGSSPKAE